MNKNIVYLIATVLAIVIVTLLAKQGDHPAPVNPAALPTNGMSAPAPAANPAGPEAVAPSAAPVASMPAPAPAPAAEGGDEVPQGAEVSGDSAPAAPAADGKNIPPSEGQ